MHFLLSFDQDYVTATEIKQVQSFCTIYIYAFIIKFISMFTTGWLQPMLRSPITTGALSLISIFTAFHKVPNLFSFMLRSGTRRNFSLFSNTSLSFPPLKKKKLDSQHSSHVLQICVKICGKELTLFLDTSQSSSAALYACVFQSLFL